MPHTEPPRTAAARSPVPEAGQCCSMPLKETLKQLQACLRQSLVGGGVVTTPFPGSWCTQGFVCAFQASPESMRFDLNMTALLLPSCHSFSFALGFGVPFFGVFQHSPIDVCSAASCDFGVLAGWDDCTSFYSAILDCSLPVSSAHGILQARILECVVILFSRGSFNLGTKPGSPASQAYCFTIWATREVLPMRWLNINILFGST